MRNVHVFPENQPYLAMSYRVSLLLLIAVLTGVLTLPGRTQEAEELRLWKSRVGSELRAKAVKIEGDNVILEELTGKRRTVAIDKLSDEDQEYLREHPTLGSEDADQFAGGDLDLEPLEAPLPERGSISEEISCENRTSWSYYLYLPETYTTKRKWPVMYVMDPGGGSSGSLKRYVEGGRRNQFVLAMSKQSRNYFDKSSDAVNAMVKDVEKRVSIDGKRRYASGNSGGARMAYWLAGKHTCAGLLPCSAGGSARSKTIVYSLLGTNDFNRWGIMSSHERMRNRHNQVRFFPGNHDWAKSELIAEGMSYLNGKFLQSQSKMEADQRAFARAVWETVDADADPGRAFEWADFFANDFPGAPEMKAEASKVFSTLERDSRAELHARGKREVERFAKKHFATGDPSDYLRDTEVPSRDRAAMKLAEEYASTPWGAVFQRIGKPCVQP